MGFNLQGWGRASSNANSQITVLQDGSISGSPSFFTYITGTDDINTITETNYFGEQCFELDQTDLIYVAAADGIVQLYVVSVDEVNKSVTTAIFEGGGGGGSGNVTGPITSTNHAIARYDGTSGTLIGNSIPTIDDAGNLANLNSIDVAGSIDIFANGGVKPVRWWNTANTFYTGLRSGSTIRHCLYTLPDDLPAEDGMTLTADTDGTTQWATSSGAQWVSSSTNISMVSGNGYIPTNSLTRVVFTLPLNPRVGDSLEIRGNLILGAAGWKVAQPASGTAQQIEVGIISTIPGSSGYIQSSDPTDAVYLVCTQNGGGAIVWTSIGWGNIQANTISGLQFNNPANIHLPVPVSEGGTGFESVTAYGVVVAGADSSDPMSTTATGVAGQVLTSNGAGAAPTFQNGGGGGGENFSIITTGPQAMVQGTTYMTNSGSLIQCNLPSTCPVDAIFGVQGMGTGGWKLKANTGQTIHFNSADTSTGGYLASTNRYDGAVVVCSVANTEFIVFRSGGAAITVG